MMNLSRLEARFTLPTPSPSSLVASLWTNSSELQTSQDRLNSLPTAIHLSLGLHPSVFLTKARQPTKTPFSMSVSRKRITCHLCPFIPPSNNQWAGKCLVQGTTIPTKPSGTRCKCLEVSRWWEHRWETRSRPTNTRRSLVHRTIPSHKIPRSFCKMNECLTETRMLSSKD